MTDSFQNVGPLSGTTILELAGIGPGPYCGQLFADLGATVIQVRRPATTSLPVENRGKQPLILDLKNKQAVEVVLRLSEHAHALIEGYRPGVAERLGVGPEVCLKRNPALVYGRMTGWGQEGPLATRAGHDINYIGLTGALYAMGRHGEPPSIPLNLVGDYGGGSLFLALGVLAALLKARATGKGDVVDAAIIDGTASMLGVVRSLSSIKGWSPARQANLIDGARPYYRSYATSDQQYMAVGCLEPEFFAILLQKLDLSPEQFGHQNDANAWPHQHALLERIFSGKTRDEWSRVFDGTDACVTPVLNYEEAPEHPHNRARNSYQALGSVMHPRPAPRFASRAGAWHPPSPANPISSADILRTAGFKDSEIGALQSEGVLT